MKYCSGCGAEIPDGYDECPFCGTPVPKYEEAYDMFIGDSLDDDDEYWTD